MSSRKPYQDVLAELGLPDVLATFDARVVGTPPLGLDTPESDIDLICQTSSSEAFIQCARALFGAEEDFTVEVRDLPLKPVVVNFTRSGWPVELFAIDQPTHEQPGWLHFDVERRLIALAGQDFLDAVRCRRSAGSKTEPAFAAALGLPGDPFSTLVDLSHQGDAKLIQVLDQAGFAARC